MIQIYVKYKDNEFYLLDLEGSDVVNLKVIRKDLKDITKIFAPFTQSFTIKATDKNKILFGFIGNEKVFKDNNTSEFFSKIYVGGFLYESGILTIEETNLQTYKASFASNLTGLKEKLGDLTIRDVFEADQNLNLIWSNNTMYNSMSSISLRNLNNGIPIRFGIPFISNKRVWNYEPDNNTLVDNIAFNPTVNTTLNNRIELFEVRPALDFVSIIKHIILKLEVPVIAPIFERPEIKELFVWCNSQSLLSENTPPYAVTGFGNLSFLNGNNGRWIVSKFQDTFKVVRNNSFTSSVGYFEVRLKFNGLVSLEGDETKIIVNLVNATTNVILNSQEITNDTYKFKVVDGQNGSLLDSNGELSFRFEILPITLMNWTNINSQIIQFGIPIRIASCTTNTLSYLLGGNNLNLATALPNIKCTDFLKSFFNAFNIEVISTGKEDNSMYWINSDDINSVNLEYSKRDVDYTPFMNIEVLNKKTSPEFNAFQFNHKESKYYDSVYGNGTRFGALQFPELLPEKSRLFEVKTDFSIMNFTESFAHPSGIRTVFGFERSTPTVLPNGSNRFNSVFDECTLLYLSPRSWQNNPIGVSFYNSAFDFGTNTNKALNAILQPNFFASNFKSLAFGAENAYESSLYLNYYKTLIERLINVNTYRTEFEGILPPNEIFLNFSNPTQGQSNIPTGFRPQNEIIIGELRYELLEANINLIDGKTKLILMNI